MDLKYLTTGLKANAGGFDAIITSSVVDVDGEVVVPTGIRNRAEYLANPLVFWAHEWAYDRAAEPIGRATRLDVFADRIESSAEFAPTPIASTVSAASSATGTAPVPAVMSATLPVNRFGFPIVTVLPFSL